ncbi:MAG: response regulator [Verrucomicrobiota bacterium]
MSLLDSNEILKKCFTKDASYLTERIEQSLEDLVKDPKDAEAIRILRDATHGLQGTSAMVQVRSIDVMAASMERLWEICTTFVNSSPDRATDIYRYTQESVPLLKSAIKKVLSGKDKSAMEEASQFEKGVLERWGGYFHNESAPAVPEPVNEEEDVSLFLKSVQVEPSLPDRTNEVAHADLVAEVINEMPETVDPEFLKFFILETTDSLEEMEQSTLSWEKSPDDRETGENVFRLVHSIKGAAGGVGMIRLGKVAHALEDIIEAFIEARTHLDPKQLINVTLAFIDGVRVMISEASGNLPRGEVNQKIQPVVEQIVEMVKSVEWSSEYEPKDGKSTSEQENHSSRIGLDHLELRDAQVAEGPADLQEAQQVLRVESNRLDDLMNLVGELVINRSRLDSKLKDVTGLQEELDLCKNRLIQLISDFQEKYEYSVGVNRRPDGLIQGSGGRNVFESQDPDEAFSDLELDQYDDFNILSRALVEIGSDTSEIINQINRFFGSLSEETVEFSSITNLLQDEITGIRMVPLDPLFRRLRRAVRDVSISEDKPVELHLEGNETRLDKVIVDRIYTPLLHIVRNAVSHGIEDEQGRKSAGKDLRGSLSIEGYQEGNEIIIEISDDGRGVDYLRIRQRAVALGLLREDEMASTADLYDLLFRSGFSTRETADQISGRGVGLDVVRRTITQLNGSIRLSSEDGKGTKFQIRLPLSLSINVAMLVGVGEESYAIPLNFVQHVLDQSEAVIKQGSEGPLLQHEDQFIPIVSLRQIVQMPQSESDQAKIVILKLGDQMLGVQIDRVVNRQDIVIKPLGRLLEGHWLFTGATLGGEGDVILILDTQGIFKWWKGESVDYLADSFGSLHSNEEDGVVKKRVLYVEDSLSMRQVAKRYLEELDCEVETAVDGLDALEKIRGNHFSAIFTDLEMPRMNGFELISEVRRQSQLGSIPVVVVTSRDAAKHRERAMKAGATGYVIKPFRKDELQEFLEVPNLKEQPATHA